MKRMMGSAAGRGGAASAAAGRTRPRGAQPEYANASGLRSENTVVYSGIKKVGTKDDAFGFSFELSMVFIAELLPATARLAQVGLNAKRPRKGTPTCQLASRFVTDAAGHEEFVLTCNYS